MGSPDFASKAFYAEHLGESPTIMEGESVIEASVQQREAAEEQHIVLGRRLPDQYGTAYPNKRRLVITAMSSEPILIEIRQPDVQQSMPYLGAANCSQCDLGRMCLQDGDQNSPSCKDLRKELSLIFRNREIVDSNVRLWIEEQAKLQESPSDSETQTETWTELCMKAVGSMQFLEGELKTLKEIGEQDALRMASMSRGLQNELEREKEMREHDGRASDARILKLQTQLARQAEEIERQWKYNKDATYDQTQDLKRQTAIKTSGLLGKCDCNTLGELLSSTQRLKDNEVTEDPITDKETECETLRLKIEELKEALAVASADSLTPKIKEMENRDEVHKGEHQQALAKEDTEIEKLRMEVEEYKLKIEEMKLGDLDSEDRSLKDRVDSEKALADSEILRLKVKELMEENLVTLASAESLKLKVEEMRTGNVNLETQFSNYKEEHKQALANKEAQTENLRMEVEKCKAKIDQMEERILMLDTQLSNAKEEQEKALVNEAEYELLKLEAEKFKLKMEDMNSGKLRLETQMMQEKLHYQNSLAGKEGECEMLKVMVEEFKLKIEEMNSGKLSLENQMMQEKLHHQKSLAEKEADCEVLRMKVEEFTLKIEQMDTDGLYLSQEREEHQKALADKEAECDVLRKRIKESNRDHPQSHQLEIQEMEKEETKEEQLEEPISTSVERGNVGVVNYVTTLEGERDHLLRELERVTKNYNRAASKLKENVAKRRKLEAESEGENQQRSNLVAALYDLEGEVEVTVSTIKSLETSTIEGVRALTADLQNFQEELEKAGDLRMSQTECSEHNGSDNIAPVNNVDEQSPLKHNPNPIFPEVDNVKGIAEANSTIAKIASGIEKLLSEISSARVAIRKALKAFSQVARTANNEILVKLEILQNERENLRHELKNIEDDNKELENENLSLARELSSLKAGKEKMSLQMQDLEKEIGTLQDDLAGLRDENRRLLKEAKWKSVGKQGGYQESLVIKEWEKKLEKLEDDYANLRKEKKALVEEKHRLEDEVDRARDKGFMSRDSCEDGEDDRKLENKLSSVTKERNKLRKVRIALAVENVSLKETLTELRTKADVLEAECEALRVWKDKVGKLEEECEDLRDWKSKAEALEAECEELRGREKMKEEAREIQCEMQKWRTKAKKLEDECCNLVKSKASVEEECSNLRTRQVSLEAERDNLLDLKHKSENLEAERAQLYDYKLKVETVEKGIQSDNRAEDVLGLEFEEMWDYKCVRELKQKVRRLEEENLKLCQCHQAALDKQWDVLEADLKAFETKVEELETECATVRRNHLSTILGNSQLAKEKELFQKLFNEHKCTLEIMETAYECLQKEQARKDTEISKERNGYYTSIDNLTRKVNDLESTFSERLRQQAASYAHYLAPKNQGQGQDTVFLTRQEYEFLLAEKSVILQERDGAHKKLCSIETQNVHLNATIDCLRQEVAKGRSHETIHADINAQVLLAQEIVNLQSILTSLQEEVAKENSEKQRVFAMNASLRQELNRAQAALKVRKEKKKLLDFKVKESERCRSLIEQRQVTESSLTKQLTEIKKERDSLQERLLMVFKQRAQLDSAVHERDDLILSLKEQITKVAKERENAVCLPKEELALPANGRNGPEFVKTGRTGSNVSFHQKVLDLEKSVHSLGAQLSNMSEQTKAELLQFSNSLALGKDSLLEAVSAGNYGHILHENANVSLMTKEMPMSTSKVTRPCDGVTLAENLHDFGAILRSLNEQLANLAGERDQLTLAKQSLMQERDHPLAAVAQLDTRKNSMSTRSEQDLHVEVSSVKSSLATTARETEQIAISSGSLQQKLDDLFSTIQCLNTQVASLSSEKDHLLYTNGAVTNERDTLPATVSIPQKREDNSSHREMDALLSHDFDKLVSDPCPQPVLENSIQSGRKTDDEDKESTSYQEASKLTQENSPFLEQSERLKQERDNLAAELALLKKEKDCGSGKKLRRKWNLKRPQDEIASLLKDNERLAASEASLKQHLAELERKFSKVNSTLGQEKLLLMEDRENIIEEVSLLKKEKDNFERKVEVESIRSMTELQQMLVDKQDQHSQMVENYRLLTEERAMLSAQVLQPEQQTNTTEKMERELTGATATLVALGSNSKQMLVQVETNDQQERERDRRTQPELAVLEASIGSLKKQQVALVNEKTQIVQENEALKKERDEILLCISSLKKQHEAILAKAWSEKESAAASEACMKQKIDEFVTSLQPLSKPYQAKHHAVNKGHRSQDSNIRPECGTMHEGEKTFLSPPCDNHAHQQQQQQQQPDVVKVDANETSVEQKLHGIALIMFTLRERLEATSQEKDRLNSNINPLKEECNKLRLAHTLSEQEKNILSKRITEMHATAERLASEIARLQSALAESDKKLARATAEKESAFLRVAELQAQRAQEHLQTPYSMEKVQTLEAENRRLRIDKDVFEDRLRKCTMELEAAKRRATTDTLNEYNGKTSYLYEPTPLMKYDPVNLQPPLHNPTVRKPSNTKIYWVMDSNLIGSSSYLSGQLSPCNILGRPQLPLPSIMQSPQWPNV